MKRRWIIGAVAYLGILAGCSEYSADERMADAGTTESDTLKNTVSTEVAKDSTLQPIEEVKLRALGNTLDEIRFDKDTIKVSTGALVKVEYVNEGTALPMVHNLIIADSGTYKQVALAGEKVGSSGNYIPVNADLLAASPMALPGQTVIVEFQAPLKPAVYDFVCTYPDHWRKMHGTLIVK